MLKDVLINIGFRIHSAHFDYGPPIGGSPLFGPYGGTIAPTFVMLQPFPVAGEPLASS
jgi:hypothetical protein